MCFLFLFYGWMFQNSKYYQTLKCLRNSIITILEAHWDPHSPLSKLGCSLVPECPFWGWKPEPKQTCPSKCILKVLPRTPAPGRLLAQPRGACSTGARRAPRLAPVKAPLLHRASPELWWEQTACTVRRTLGKSSKSPAHWQRDCCSVRAATWQGHPIHLRFGNPYSLRSL